MVTKKKKTNMRAQGQVFNDDDAFSLARCHLAKPRTGFITQPSPDIWWRSMKWHIYSNAETVWLEPSGEMRASRVSLEASARKWLPVGEPVRTHMAPARSFTNRNPLESKHPKNRRSVGRSHQSSRSRVQNVGGWCYQDHLAANCTVNHTAAISSAV